MSQIIVTYRHTSRLSMRIGKEGEVRVSAPYGLPKEEVERFVEEHREWITKAQAKTLERLRKRNEFYDQLPLNTKAERKDAIDRLNVIVQPMVERYSVQMGVQPAAISYRATISKWGSCQTRTKRIQFSIYLLLLPERCIEYVVAHELAHLLVPDHSPRFYAVLGKYFPRWREARLEIRRISRMETK